VTVYRAVNATFQLGHNATLIRTAAEGVDVLGLVECRDAKNQPVDVAAILGSEFDTRQDTSSGARAGSVLTVRKSSGIKVKRSRLRLLSAAARGVQRRDMRVTTILEPGYRTRVIVAHNPTPDTGKQPQAVRRTRRAISHARRWANRARRKLGLRQRRWIWLGDANMQPDDFARAIDAPHHFGAKPMVAAWSEGFGDVQVAAQRFDGSDHAVLTITTKE